MHSEPSKTTEGSVVAARKTLSSGEDQKVGKSSLTGQNHQHKSANVLSLLEKNKTNAILPVNYNVESDDEVIAVDGPDLSDIQREELDKLRTIDTIQKWSATFGSVDQQVIVQNAEFINRHKQRCTTGIYGCSESYFPSASRRRIAKSFTFETTSWRPLVTAGL